MGFRVRVVLMVACAAAFAGATAVDTPETRAEGKPAFSEGDALGYFVWKDGDKWKLRWTTFGAAHRFTGRVAIVGGSVESFKRVDVDEERKVIAPGRPVRVVRGPRGRVRAVAGGRPPLVASRDEDYLEQADERTIRFNTKTDDDLDGLDFKIKGPATELRLFLMIDGVPRPAQVEIGKKNFKPNVHPVVIRLN